MNLAATNFPLLTTKPVEGSLRHNGKSGDPTGKAETKPGSYRTVEKRGGGGGGGGGRGAGQKQLEANGSLSPGGGGGGNFLSVCFFPTAERHMWYH